jgi:hypothetical protein
VVFEAWSTAKDGTGVPRGHRSFRSTLGCVAGELVDIGLRPKLVASFDPPDAEERFARWRDRNAAALEAVPPHSLRVEYGRTGAGLYVRVRVDESAVPSGLSDE